MFGFHRKAQSISLFRSSCPVCQERQGIDLWGAKARDHIRGHYFRIILCSNCRLGRTEPVPEPISSYYPKQYRRYKPPVSILLNLLYRLKVQRWAKTYFKSGKVLEIGCGDGLMLRAFKQLGWTVLGVERSVQAAEIALTNNLQVLTDLHQIKHNTNKFDLIILYHSLEHLHDPVSVLRTCRSHLAMHGKIIITVPNFASYQAVLTGPHWLHLDPPRHLIHFTLPSLDYTLRQAGFQRVSLRYNALVLDTYGWIESIMNCLGYSQNLFTGFLMGLQQFSFELVLVVCIELLLLPLAILLSCYGWLMSKGAILEVIAVKDSN